MSGKNFVRSFDKYVIKYANGFFVCFALIDVFIDLIRQNVCKYLQLVNPHTFSLVNCYVVLESFLAVLPLFR